MISKLLIAASAATVLALAACDEAPQQPDISISDGWVRSTVPGQSGSAAYFTIINSGGPDVLLSVSSPAADASLHSSTSDDGVARMRPLNGIEIPAGSTVELAPGGDHVMLMALTEPLAEGSSFPVLLQFERSGQLGLDLPVRTGGGAK